MTDPSGIHPKAVCGQAADERDLELALAIEAGQLATWAWFVAEDHVVWSERMFGFYGYDVREVVPTYALWASHLHPDDCAAVEGELERSMREGTHYAVEFRIRPAGGGTERWLRARGQFHYGADGAPVQLVGVVSDETQRRAAEQALREKESRYRVALNHAPLTIHQLDRELRYEWGHNPHPDTPDGLIGMRAGDSLPPDQAEPYVKVLRDVVETGEKARQELTFEMPSGRVVADITVEPVRDEAGEVVGVIAAAYDITEMRRVEAALRDSEARFRELTDTAPVLVWMADTTKACTYFNRTWLEFTGRTMEQELGDGWTEGVHRDDLDRCMAIYTTHFDRREPFEMEYRLCARDQEYRWIVDRGVPRFDADGTFLGYLGSCFDVHDRKLAETHATYLAETGTLVEQALSVEATLQQIARLGVPGFADWCAVDLLHPDGSISAIAIAHADPEKVRWGWDLRESEPVDPDAPTGAPNVIRTGEPELYPHIPDDMLVSVARDEDHLRLLRDIGFSSVIVVPMRVGATVAGALSFVNADSGRRFDPSDLATAIEIGRRAGAAMETARLYAALGEREARLRQLAEALPQIVYTSGPDGHVDYLNRRWFEYTGQPDDVPPATAADSVVHPDDAPELARRWNEAQVEATPFEAEVRLQRADGDYRWFLTRVVPLLNSNGTVQRWFGTSTDIHLQKAAEAELSQRVGERTAELERSNQELDQFAYIASHDLKGPLRGIDSLASWIEEDAADVLPADSRRHLGLLRSRVHRLEQLLESLLVYSRAGRTAVLAEPVDLAALVHDTVLLLDLPAAFQVDTTDVSLHLTTYRAPLELVVRNLVGNAIKHHHRADGRVRVSARETGSLVEISVTDDGPGISPEYHERAFDLFQTLRPRDEVEGSGMGLAVVKKTVESLGGSIRLVSEPGDGATFTFTWPVVV